MLVNRISIDHIFRRRDIERIWLSSVLVAIVMFDGKLDLAVSWSSQIEDDDTANYAGSQQDGDL
jgi:hypothetical protein